MTPPSPHPRHAQLAGTPRWKTLFHRAWKPRTPAGGSHTRPTPWTRWPNLDSREKVLAKVHDPGSMRFMWLRNPYSRLLSAFLEKICSGKWRGVFGGPFSCTPPEFGRYIRALLSRADRGAYIDPHFTLQVDHCGLGRGVEYDYYLKVEESNEWYPEFMALAGLAGAAKHGWGRLGAPDCFMELPGLSCEETDAYIRSLGQGTRQRAEHRATVQAPGGLPGWMQTKTTGHAMGADAQLREFFATQEIIDLATEYVQRDLEAFGYPKMQADRG